MRTEFIVLLGIWLLPIGIYVPRAWGSWESHHKFPIRHTFLGIWLSFIVGCLRMYVQSDETIKLIEGGYSTITFDPSIAWHLVAWGIWAALGDVLVHAGWGLLKKRRGGGGRYG